MPIAKTEAGLQVVKDRSVGLSPRQRSLLILVDGRRTLDELVSAALAIGSGREDVAHLLDLGLIAELGAAPQAQPAAPAEAAGPEAPSGADERTPQQRYRDAYPIATRLTADLGLRGLRLNLAVEAAGSYEQLLRLAPKILAAVGQDKFAPLGRALGH